jgi:hypothetical protein
VRLLLERVTASPHGRVPSSKPPARFARARLAAVVLALALGCGAAPREGADPSGASQRFDAWKTVHSVDGGYSVSMPAPAQEKLAQEGPMRASILWGIDSGTRYEVAYFDMPEPLEDTARDRLLGKVERGLGGAPGVRATRKEITVGGVAGFQLDVTLPDNRSGRWWIFFLRGMRMFQVSALGPAGDRLSAGMTTFFQSFQLAIPDPPS